MCRRPGAADRSRKGCNPVYKKNGHICRGLCYNDDRWRSRYAARYGTRAGRIYGTVAGTPPEEIADALLEEAICECGGSVPDDMSVIVTEISDNLRTQK